MMKGQTMEDVLRIIERQQTQIEQLERQVSSLLSRDNNGNDCDTKIANGEHSENNIQNGNHPEEEVKEIEDRHNKGGTSLESRVLELEVVIIFINMSSIIRHLSMVTKDVVFEMKGEMIELMMVYQDIQDKLYDIDRSWQNSLVFHNVKQVTDIGLILASTFLCNETFSGQRECL